MTTMSEKLVEEVRGVLDGKPSGDEKPKTEYMEDPSDEALTLLKTHKELGKTLQSKVDNVLVSLGAAQAMAKGKPELALEAIEGGPLVALREMRHVIDMAIQHVERVVRMGKQTRGHVYNPMKYEARMRFLDDVIGDITEGRTPNPDPVPHNASTNDYAAELAAAAIDAEKFIGSMRALEVGQNIYIGRRSLQVASAPMKREHEWWVTLHGQETKGFTAAPDAYTLVIPERSGATTECELRYGDPEDPAKRQAVKLYPVDIRLTENYGDHMYDYPDYGPAMGRIKPGDAVNITQTVFRVIGKSGNSALVQPDAIHREMYGDFRPGGQARVPVGQGVPSIGKTDQETPAMGRIPSGQDFAGRGGTGFQDTSTSAPRSGGGRTPLIGLQVLNYNPHSGKYSFPSGTKPGEYKQAMQATIVGHDPNMKSVVGQGSAASAKMTTVEGFESMVSEADGDTLLEKLQAVVDAGEPMKVNEVLVDPFIAEATIQLHEGLNEDNQERLRAMSTLEMVSTVLRVIGQAAQAAE